MAEAGETIRSNCNKCGGPKNHTVLHRENTSWDEDLGHGNSIWGTDTYLLVKCGGCDDVHLRHESSFSEDHNDGEPTVIHYPPALSRQMPEWIGGLGWVVGSSTRSTIASFLREIYAALQNDSRRLAAMGIRAVLELVMIDKVTDHGAIGKNVTEFLAAGYVPVVSHDLFKDTMIEAGHAAMHRSYQPTKEHLEVLMDLTEWLIVSIYVHPARAAKVKANIPQRSA